MSRLDKLQIEKLLASRFYDDECSSLKELPKPSLLKDIDKASKRIAQAIKNGEKITVVGDYDVDGVVSSVLMSEFFEDIGKEIDLIIPNRFVDGYGINEKILERIEADLIITVDNGISAVKAAEICQSRGIDLIITDHHNIPPKLPKAYAIINPKQEDCNFPHDEICGAQVAWYLIASLKSELGLDGYDLRKYLDILALAIVADMMELKGLNRAMVKAGFKMINRNSRVIFAAIKNYFNKERFQSDDISFLIAPLINSAGRMEDAKVAFDMLRSGNFQEAIQRLEYVVGLNNQRKDIESDIFHQALEVCDTSSNIIIVWGEGWHEGVIGIVAARLCRRFNKPSIVFSINNDVAKGSARSVGEVDILSLIASQKELLLGFGGHKSAAGLSIKNSFLEEFKANLEQLSLTIPKEDFVSNDDLLGEIDPKEIDFALIEILESYEPYGQKNPKPKFLIKDAKVKSKRVLGVSQNHLQLLLDCEKRDLNSIYFNFTKKASEGDRIDLICSITKNEFRGQRTIQLIVERIDPLLES